MCPLSLNLECALSIGLAFTIFNDCFYPGKHNVKRFSNIFETFDLQNFFVYDFF